MSLRKELISEQIKTSEKTLTEQPFEFMTQLTPSLRKLEEMINKEDDLEVGRLTSFLDEEKKLSHQGTKRKQKEQQDNRNPGKKSRAETSNQYSPKLWVSQNNQWEFNEGTNFSYKNPQKNQIQSDKEGPMFTHDHYTHAVEALRDEIALLISPEECEKGRKSLTKKL